MELVKRNFCSFLFLTLISVKLFVIINVYIRRTSKNVSTVDVDEVVFQNEDDSYVIMNEKKCPTAAEAACLLPGHEAGVAGVLRS